MHAEADQYGLRGPGRVARRDLHPVGPGGERMAVEVQHRRVLPGGVGVGQPACGCEERAARASRNAAGCPHAAVMPPNAADDRRIVIVVDERRRPGT